MGLMILFSVLDDGLKDSRVLSHDLGLETHFDVSVFMRQHLDRFGENFEAKLLHLFVVPFSHVEFNRARYLIEV